MIKLVKDFTVTIYKIYLRISKWIIELRLKKIASAGCKELIDNDYSGEWIIFSKDRALQLHAFLSSYFEMISSPPAITVLYATSNDEHEKTYRELNDMFVSRVKFIKETNFRKQLISYIENCTSNKIVFFCDDGLVIEKLNFMDLLKFNPLRIMAAPLMGLDWTYCFAYGRDQELPPFESEVIQDKEKLVWVWDKAVKSPDWSYPLAVGGHFFLKKELMIMLKYIRFKAPNSLEGNLQIFKKYYSKRYGVSYTKSHLASIPINIVNSEVLTNPVMGDFSVDELLEKWNEGYRLSYEDYYHKTANEILKIELRFVKR